MGSSGGDKQPHGREGNFKERMEEPKRTEIEKEIVQFS